MAFGQGGARRSSGGSFGGRSSGGNAPQRGGQGGGGGQGGAQERNRSVWHSALSLYDPFFSALDVIVVSDFYKSSLGLKLAPVFDDRRGNDDAGPGAGKKYDHDNTMSVVLELHELVCVRHQLESFINGQLSEFIIPRGDFKRVVFGRAESYFDVNHPEHELHAGGLVMSVEEDATERLQARNMIFVSRPKEVILRDFEDDGVTAAEPAWFYPEMMALLALVDSYIGNVARVDSAAVRYLLDRDRTPQADDRAPSPVVSAPVRRTTGVAATPTATAPAAARPGLAVTRPATGLGARPAARTGAAAAPAQSAGIDSALDAIDNAVTDVDLDSVLGDAPKF